METMLEELGDFSSWFSFDSFNAIQRACLPTLLDTGKNVVISAPTGSGKTALFELAMIRELKKGFTKGDKMIYLAPLKALCTEKIDSWKSKLNSYNISCIDYSSDDSGLGHLDADVIICTSEKLEYNSRLDDWMQQVKLVMIDEVHFLNDDRGAVLEAVVSRLRIQSPSCRIVAVSATIPNIKDIANWLYPAKVCSFNDSMRPVPLQVHVFGYQKGIKKAFDFEFGLNYRLPGLISKYSEGKQTLVFCSTRQSTEKTAQHLADKLPQMSQNFRFDNDKLNYYVNHGGVAFHHAGLSQKDRSKIEQLFRDNHIRVLCATSTLAVGVNLPARLVIIKSTLKYAESGYQEYNDLEIRQMIGRAGRAGFDSQGTALIMTDTRTQSMYKNMSEGKVHVKSHLSFESIVDYLNVEIASSRITNLAQAQAWLYSTFLAAEQQFSEKDCIKMIKQAIGELSTAGLITSNLEATPTGLLVANNFISLETFKYFSLRVNESCVREAPDFLELICACPEVQAQFPIRHGDKEHLFKLSSDPRLRFPSSSKPCLLLQASLQHDLQEVITHLPPRLRTEMDSICQDLTHILKFMVGLLEKRGFAVGLRCALELLASVSGRAFCDDPKNLQQIDGLGPVYARKLSAAGVQNISDLKTNEESRLEVLCGRNPPFGHQILSFAAEHFPILELNVSLTDSQIICNVSITGKVSTTHLIVISGMDSSSTILHHEIFSKQTKLTRQVKLNSDDSINYYACSLICTTCAGVNRHYTFTKPSAKKTYSTQPPAIQTTTPVKRAVPSPVSAEKSASKSKLFLGSRTQTLSNAQSFLKKYAPKPQEQITSTLLLSKPSVQQTVLDEITLELRSLDEV